MFMNSWGETKPTFTDLLAKSAMALAETEKDDRLGALRVSMDEARAARDQGFWVTLEENFARKPLGKQSEITGCIPTS